MAQIPRDLLDRIRALETEVRILRGRANIRPAMDQVLNGMVIVGDGGTFRVNSPTTGTALLVAGAAYNPDEYGVEIRRQDGSIALQVANRVVQDGPQPIRILDNGGLEIFSEDIGGGGIARPWLPLVAPVEASPARWPRTSSTTWETIAKSHNTAWQPRLSLLIPATVTSGTTGQVRVLVNGVQFGPVGPAEGPTPWDYTGDIPGSFAPPDPIEIEVQAQVTSGTGSVFAQCMRAHTLQS